MIDDDTQNGTPSSTLRSEPAAASVDATALRSTLANVRSDVTHRIKAARASSEQEVMAIGSCINAIVDRAKAYVADIQEQQRVRAEGEERTASMVKEMTAAVHKQEATVEKAMAQSSAILRAGRDVQAMASATRLLSLNARVEASRLGDQGSSFSVIADEMRQLSHAVQQTNSSVANMAKELERLLPIISQQTRTIQAQFEQFTVHVDVQLKASAGGHDEVDKSPVIEGIMESAYEALSHLAFQDPMIQSLERIHSSLDLLQAEVEAFDGGSPAPVDEAASRGAAPESEPDVEAGEVLLF